jgi:transposase InsO family protein
MDFVTDLPLSDGYRNLMVVTDRLSKDVILIPLPNLEVETVADVFLERVVAYHWLPDYIVSDRGSQFLSNFWTTLCGKMGIKRRLSTAYHPQTDGSTERMNAVVEAYLRAYINWTQTDWARWTSTAQIAIKG